MDLDTTRLKKKLDYEFADSKHLDVALRHSSLAADGPLGSNERYEFLGDRVLSLIISEMLLERFPNENEGEISRRHTALVRQETIAGVAKLLDLGSFISMEDGTELNGGRSNPSILSDCCEAVIAALYLDGGLSIAHQFISTYWANLIEEYNSPPKDAKTTLQEWAQSHGLDLPKYSEIKRSGPAHKPIFTINVKIGKHLESCAAGNSKQRAEQLAAEYLLQEIFNEKRK